MKKEYQLIALDTCSPDYFRGHHKPVLTVFVWGGMNPDEFVESVVDEYNMTWDHLVMEGYEFDDKAEKAWPDLTDKEMKLLAIDMLTEGVKRTNGNVFPDLPDKPEEDDEEGWADYDFYCHIVWEEV